MKRIGWLLLLVCLTGCVSTNKELERGIALRSKLLSAQSCSFDAEINADYGENSYIFALSCEGNGEGDVAFTVTSPESIAGITGKIDAEGGKLTFEDTVLHFDRMADDQISPVSASWIMLNTLRSGYLRAAGMENDYLRLTIDDTYEEDALQLDIWLGEEDLPVRCEMLYAGRRILSVNVTNFQIQ